MAVQFDDRRITIFGDSASYDPYYFAIASEDDGTDYRSVLKHVLRQWADALRQTDTEALFLPFGIYDQCVEGFIATKSGNQVTLRCAWVDREGHSLDLRDLGGFMASKPEVVKQCPENFGVYNRAVLGQALAEAEPSPA